jgi:hypothetical protein
MTPHVGAGVEQMRYEGVPQHVRSHVFADPGVEAGMMHRLAHGPWAIAPGLPMTALMNR